MKIPFCALIVAAAILAGCSGMHPTVSSVDDTGLLSLSCPNPGYDEEGLAAHGNYSAWRLTLKTQTAPVYAAVWAPENPRAAFVHVPGAGVPKEGHDARAARYAEAGYAYLVLDPRGNGGETSGYPLDFDRDYTLFHAGKEPQYYEIVCDIVASRKYLTERINVPVYAVGESNGGRYALIATALDPGFAGFIGISTSGFGLIGEEYGGDARKFLLSVDPSRYAGLITPRPVIIFHSRNDSVIPYDEGIKLYNYARDPRKFVDFNGTHGVNEEVDTWILSEWAQIYPGRS